MIGPTKTQEFNRLDKRILYLQADRYKLMGDINTLQQKLTANQEEINRLTGNRVRLKAEILRTVDLDRREHADRIDEAKFYDTLRG